MHDLAGSTGKNPTGYFKQGDERMPAALCLVSSDSGLCGMYNQNILRAGLEFLERDNRQKTKLILIGQKGIKYFKSKNLEILDAYTGQNAKFNQEFCDKITSQLSGLFLSGKVSTVYLAYTSFKNALIQKPVVEQFLSILPKAAKPVEYIAEPGLGAILEDLVPRYLKIKMQLVLLDAFTCEHAARTVSMKTATENAQELLEGLILFRNKVRQAAITQDILEITSSAEALRG
jgi:F-type H+-transporting ATPase subunit gamma